MSIKNFESKKQEILPSGSFYSLCKITNMGDLRYERFFKNQKGTCAIVYLGIVFLFVSVSISVCEEALKIGRLKYSGGGDWYANPTSLPNLFSRLEKDLKISLSPEESVSLDSVNLWKYSLLYATGHGNISFSPKEAQNLKTWLHAGGFLWVDDNYGMDAFFRKNILKVFENDKLVPLSSEHELYRCFYPLEGLPKIHEHDGEPAQGFAIFHEGRMVLFYSYSSDIGDGMEDLQVHNDPPELHEKALQFGVNLVFYVLNH